MARFIMFTEVSYMNFKKMETTGVIDVFLSIDAIRDETHNPLFSSKIVEDLQDLKIDFRQK